MIRPDPAGVQRVLTTLRDLFENGPPDVEDDFEASRRKDGRLNIVGVFATLDGLTAAQASMPTAPGTSIAAQAARLADDLEVSVRWMRGDRKPFDWPGTFEPRSVDDAGWARVRARVRHAYAELAGEAAVTTEWDVDSLGSIAASIAQATVHLSAIRHGANPSFD